MTEGFVHVKNLEKYHLDYKDRHLIWCKVYFTMLDGDPEFEMIDEIDKWRFIAFIILELKSKKPVPLDKKYLSRKGFNLKKRPISKTLQMLRNFIEVRNNMLQKQNNPVTHIRLDYNRIDYNRIDYNTLDSMFNQFWNIYPIKKGKQEAKKAWFKISPDNNLLKMILENVSVACRSRDWKDSKYIPHPATFLNQKRWHDEYELKKSLNLDVLK